ncbi:MAG: M1 family metallopeptidase [Thermoanaerobaculia bacterium]
MSAETDPTYVALRAAKPDGRTIVLTNFTFDRDVLRFTLNGTLHLLAPVEDKTAGAVFVGQGSYELKPATPQEQRQLAINSGDDKLETLSDQFDSAIFLGGALIAAAQEPGAPVAGTPTPVATDLWGAYLRDQREGFHWNVHIRLLQEILNGESDPFFLAWVNGKKIPSAILSVDPLDDEQTTLIVLDANKGGLWYSSRLKRDIERGEPALRLPPVDPSHYLIDVTIKGDELSATTTMTFTPNTSLRVLPINLFRKLRVSAAEWALAADAPAWSPLPLVQEAENEDASRAVVFPAPLQIGQTYLLRMTYAGREVLENAGDGNYAVGARTSWYPNVAVFDDLAQYELRFRHPQKMQVVAVGSEASNTVEGNDRVAVWKTANPIRVAGFNYGKFKKLRQSDKDSGMTVEVYTNPGTPDIVRDINRVLAAQGEGGEFGLMGEHVQVDTASLAQAALADGINTARTGNFYFGPLSESRIAITQQSQWNSGQSWPSLIYLPYVAFLTGTQRNTLGLNQMKDFVDSVGPHEFAHQWWGHQIGWRTYRDQWLSEGFAEFTAALVLQQSGGWPVYDNFFEKARRNILEKPRAATISNDQAGPITQGYRLSTWRNLDAYGAIVYSKGAYVVHMLRMQMQDPKNGDAAFIAMMKEFAATYAGSNASTADFKRIVEKHATPGLKLTKDGKLDWFFNQWVHGTAIPKYESKFDVQSLGGGKYKVTGSITQSEVPGDFGVVMPIYVHFDKKSLSRMATTLIVGNTTKPIEFEIALPKKPQKITINAMHDVLAR